MQKVLTMSTLASHGGTGLRAEAVGWSIDDGDYAAARGVWGGHEDVGMIGSPISPHTYGTPLQALGDGWRLLAPPSFNEEDGTLDWWFVKENDK